MQMNKMLTVDECGSHCMGVLYCSCSYSFSVSLKLFLNEKFLKNHMTLH